MFIQFATLAMLFFAICTITWIHKLEAVGCVCSVDRRRTFILAFAYYQIAVSVLMTLAGAFGMHLLEGRGRVGLFKWLTLAYLVIHAALVVVFLVAAFTYGKRLRDEKCACSEDFRREVLMAWAIYLTVVVGLALLAVIFGSFVIAALMSKR